MSANTLQALSRQLNEHVQNCTVCSSAIAVDLDEFRGNTDVEISYSTGTPLVLCSEGRSILLGIFGP